MQNWKLSTWTDAAQLAAYVNPREVSADAAGIPPATWFARLRETGQTSEAVGFIAHAMPRYECVVWATRALIGMGMDRSDPAMVAALRWIDNPSDTLRRAAANAGESVDDDEKPEALLCQAIFLSGGSISEEDLPAIQPPPDVCAKLSAAAVLCAAFALEDPAAAVGASLALGEAVIAGG